jgi:hypothetical protein
MNLSYLPYLRVVPSQPALLRAALLCAAVAVAILLLAFDSIAAQRKLPATEAKDHIGDKATVCGKVVGVTSDAPLNHAPIVIFTSRFTSGFLGSGIAKSIQHPDCVGPKHSAPAPRV